MILNYLKNVVWPARYIAAILVFMVGILCQLSDRGSFRANEVFALYIMIYVILFFIGNALYLNHGERLTLRMIRKALLSGAPW